MKSKQSAATDQGRRSFLAQLIFRLPFFLDEKRSKKIKTSEKQLEIYRLFYPANKACAMDAYI